MAKLVLSQSPLQRDIKKMDKVDSRHGKKTSVHRTENEDWIHGKRGKIQTFTHIFCTENPTFSVRFRIGESQYSFHYTVVFLRGKCK